MNNQMIHNPLVIAILIFVCVQLVFFVFDHIHLLSQEKLTGYTCFTLNTKGSVCVFKIIVDDQNITCITPEVGGQMQCNFREVE